MQGLKGNSRLVSATSNAKILYIDCADIPGTDCYCDDEAVEAICRRIAAAGIKDAGGIHFFDNGNYHYMSKIWTDMVQEPFSLVVFDHHPDMQESAFGGGILSCGGWVRTMLEENPMLEKVIIVGIDPSLLPETAGFGSRVVVFPEGSTVTPVKGENPLYVSIDKDAFCPACARTNWGQGSMTLGQTEAVVRMFCEGREVLGADICGCLTIEEGGTVRDQAINATADSRLADILAEYLK